jgi:hypothetical protein
VTKEQIATELAEEIRTNTKLRHRIGLSEGAETGLAEEDTIGILTDDGFPFFIKVEQG